MIRFRFTPSYADFVALNRLFGFRQSRSLIGTSILLLVAFIAEPFILYGLGHEDEGSVWRTYLTSLPVLILPALTNLLYIFNRVNVRRRWNAAEELRCDLEYEITHEGGRVRGESLEGFLQWKHLKQVIVKGGYIVLKTAQNQLYYFPETAVPDSKALLEFVRNHVPDSKRPFDWFWRNSTFLLAVIVVVIVTMFALFSSRSRVDL